MSSPGVYSKERDFTFVVKGISSDATGYVGLFRWGPVEEIVEITEDENELVRRFAKPDVVTSPYFQAAANFLQYSVPLYVVRADTTGSLNATASDTTVTPNPKIKNVDAYEFLNLDGISFLGKYPGALGNSLKVSCANAAGHATWDYADEFEYLPTGDLFNAVVVDEDGLVSGVPGTVLERYSLMSKTPGARKTDNTPAYFKDVIKEQSSFVYVGDLDSIDFTDVDSLGVYTVSLTGGADDNVSANADFITAVDLFANKETANIVRMFNSFLPIEAVIRTIDVCETRGDAISFSAPPLEAVYNTTDQTDKIIEHFGTDLNKPSSYSFQVDNWKVVYDKYNDRNVWIPCDSDAAGLHARTFAQNNPWDSPAGFNRGQLKNVIKLAWRSTEPNRNELYKNSINSIVAFKGEGTVLFGDKTALRSPSAFSRINVRSLFIIMKRNISNFARYQLFELNDYITRSLFKNACNQYLEGVRGGRGIYEYRTVCDESNNTPQVIDNNEFAADIQVKPAKSINVINLLFTAVGTGVSFQEIEGA